jgi:3-dehydroquinate synthase
METLSVALDERSYPIHIGEGLLKRADLFLPFVENRQVCVITNDVVAPLYLQQVLQTLAPCRPDYLVLPDGEEHKTLETVTRIYDHLLERNYSRSCVLIALGGGVIGDMVGFAAATYQRGVRFIQVPTTLLAQVDSSVGGKTGVNRPLGKNMVGAFYQPQAVLIDVTTLDTLPLRELKAGLAEVIKYGFINNRAFHDWIEANLPALLERDRSALIHAIKVSCQEKATIVAADETEGGVRATLNLGHTFAHAIETATGYGTWLHGEAVAAGMVMAADLSHRMGLLDAPSARTIKALVARAGLPVAPPDDMTPEQFIALMAKDKKAEKGSMKFILLEAIGRSIYNRTAPPELLEATLTAGPRLAEF